MKTKKILGYIFMVIAVILGVVIVGQLPQLVGAIFGLFKIFTVQMSSYQAGQQIGIFIYWVLHIAITITLIVIGNRWTKKQSV